MIEQERKHAKAAFDQVRAILHGEWDPIGAGVPADEYDSYAWPVLAMLQRKADRTDVETYLLWAADEAMHSPCRIRASPLCSTG